MYSPSAIVISLLTAASALDVTPQYIFNDAQPAEFPDCDFKYAGVCAVQIAMGLVSDILQGSCYALGNGGDDERAALKKIRDKEFQKNSPGTNVGTIVFVKSNGTTLVDTYIPANEGKDMTTDPTSPGPYGEVDLPTLQTRIQDGVSSEIGNKTGSFVPMSWRWESEGAVVQVLLYVKECEWSTGHVIGIVIGREPIPKKGFSSAGSISFGSISNVRRVVGRNTLDILACQTKSELEDVLYDITYTDKYTVAGGFYIFMYQFGDQDSDGIESTGDLIGLNVAHNVLKNIIGWNISAFRASVGAAQGLVDQGHDLDLALANAGATGGKWVDYVWGPLTAPYYKLSYTVGVKVDGTKYYLGSGFKMVADKQVLSAEGKVCSASSNMPCATKNVMILASMALARVLTNLPESTAFNRLSTDAEQKANDGFYVFAFNYDGTCVADGAKIANVGKKLSEIAPTGIDAAALNTRFVAGANLGGAWIEYDWKDSNAGTSYKKIAYITKLYKYTKFFYLGVAFKNTPPEKAPDCSADYAEPCAEVNVNRVVAVANTQILTAASSEDLDKVLLKMADTSSRRLATTDGFGVTVYSSTLGCPASLAAAKKCPPVLSDEAKLALTPVVEARGGWVKLAEQGSPAPMGARMAYAFPVQSTLPGVAEMVLISYVGVQKIGEKDSEQTMWLPRCAGGCPASSTCNNGRCDCDYGFRRNWTKSTAAGDLSGYKLACIDDSMQSCTAPGMGMASFSSPCVDCPKGTHKPNSLRIKKSPCLPCAEGRFSASTKAIDCTGCPLGEFLNSTGGMACSKCAAGKFSGKEGTVLCADCPAGTFTDAPGSNVCKRCPVGKFTDTEGGTQCVSCGTKLAGSSTLFQGAASSADCLCMEGSYDGEVLHGPKKCVTCGMGLRCDEPGLKAPYQAKGYYVTPWITTDVYMCEPPEACEGADWKQSVCRAPRFGFLCTECPEGMTAVSDLEDLSQAGCEDCDAGGSVVVVLAPIFCLCVLLTVVYLTHHSKLDDNPVITEGQNTIGQLIMFVQVVNACFATRVTYSDPLTSFMDGFMSHIDPDAILSMSPCLSEFMKEATTGYALQVVFPIIGIACLAIAYFISLLFCGGILSFDGIFNIIGEVLVEFYISVTLAIFAPFDCYTHPNGKSSMSKYPQIICGEGSHSGMLGLAVFGILAYPVNAIVVSLYNTYRLPRDCLANRLRILIRCEFLFGRWKPQHCWFCNVTIIRNFFIAVLPMVMPPDQLDVTLILMIMTLATALVLTVWVQPRRNTRQNVLDTFISMVQLIIMVFGLSSAHGQAVSSSLSTLLLLLVIMVVVVVFTLLLIKVYHIATPAGRARASYAVYLSHHAGYGGAAARVFHAMLVSTIKGRIFYDIDNMKHSTAMIDSIKKSQNLVVLLGSETLCRTWCIGSIVVAFRRSIPMQSVIFTDPDVEETVCGVAHGSAYIKKSFCGGQYKPKSLVEADTSALRGDGVDETFVHPGIQSLMSVQPIQLNLRDEAKMNANFQRILDTMRRGTCRISTPVDTVVMSFFGSGVSAELSTQVLIMIDHMDGEAVAVCRLLRQSLCSKVSCLQDQDIPSQKFSEIAKSRQVSATVFIFSQNTLKSGIQLARLGHLYQHSPDVHMVPIVIGLCFDFPDSDYLQDLQTSKALSLGPNPAETLLIFAGDTVTLKTIADSLVNVMTFLISFLNIAGLSKGPLNKAVAGTLDRCLLKKGKRNSHLSMAPPADASQTPAPKPSDDLDDGDVAPGDDAEAGAESAQAPNQSMIMNFDRA